MRLKIRQMVKLLAFGFIGLAALSCSKGDGAQDYQKPVEFSGYTARSMTKAGASFVTGVELPAGQSFGVYAYNTGSRTDFKPNQDTINTYGKFMTNVQVTYSGDGASNPEKYPYAYRYWPNSETSNRLAFFAYYPFDGAGITKTGFADFGFTVQDAPASQVDFMLSNIVPNQMYSSTNSTTGVVKLNFYHMLTQIRFKGITDAPSGATVKITSLKVVDVVNKGTLAPDATATSSAWTPDETSTSNYTLTLQDVALPSTAVDPSAEAVALADATQTLLMVPQTLGDGSALEVEYTITTTNPDRTITQTQTLILKDAIAAWERNQQIVYTLNIGLHPIEISASAVDWTDDEYIIIVE